MPHEAKIQFSYRRIMKRKIMSEVSFQKPDKCCTV